MFKIIGCLFIIISCTAFGFLKACDLNNRIYFLDKIKRLLLHLKGEISYSRTPMSEAFLSISDRQEGELRELCVCIAEEISKYDGRSFDKIWRDAVDCILSKSILEKKDKDEIVLIGEKISNQDYEMQIAAINLEIQNFDEKIMNLKENIFEKQRVYRVLGIFSGLMISIILL